MLISGIGPAWWTPAARRVWAGSRVWSDALAAWLERRPDYVKRFVLFFLILFLLPFPLQVLLQDKLRDVARLQEMAHLRLDVRLVHGESNNLRPLALLLAKSTALVACPVWRVE